MREWFTAIEPFQAVRDLVAIDNENIITAFPAAEQIPEGQEHFASEEELAKVAATWHADRLVP